MDHVTEITGETKKRKKLRKEEGRKRSNYIIPATCAGLDDGIQKVINPCKRCLMDGMGPAHCAVDRRIGRLRFTCTASSIDEAEGSRG
jgi:hypothetical protein